MRYLFVAVIGKIFIEVYQSVFYYKKQYLVQMGKFETRF
jgi:hypothetical protein